MAYYLKFNDHDSIVLCEKPNKQRIWLLVLLKHSDLNLSAIAELTGISEDQLTELSKGLYSLGKKSTQNLARLFLLFLSS